MERQAVNGDNNILCLKTKRSSAGNAAQFLHHQIGSGHLSSRVSTGSADICWLAVVAGRLISVIPAFAGHHINVASNLGGRHHGRHRFGVVCQFLFSHEPTSLFRVAALRLGIADAVVLLADLFQQISILCRQITKKTYNGLLVCSQPIHVFTVAHRLCHRLK